MDTEKLYTELPISAELQQAVARMGFTHMTEIQQKAIPVMMTGADIIAKAPTGTGKTCAFGIPLVERIAIEQKQPQALVLCPTRELCVQIVEDLQDLAHFKEGLKIVAVYGGQNIQRQIDALKKGAHIVVATPGRLMDHMKRRTVSLAQVETAVLDEADEMLNMGFYKDVCKILESLKNKKQMVMFSATISREVMDVGWLYQRDPEEITVQPVEENCPKIEQYSIVTTGRNKVPDLARIMINESYKKVIVFCNTKYASESVASQLVDLNFIADSLNGDMSQKDRNRIMDDFREDKIAILVATDVAARGLDITGVEAVFNYDMPASNEYYTHRIGRTGRAKREGVAYTFVTPDDTERLRNIIRYTRNNIVPATFDESGKLVPVTPEEGA